ncbi:glycerate kinase [Roseivirga thermotolerans]|uniref:glycerate kinase n=1 Tax=Roseivirga thermotolerans TaxID=1758176 RepID=UPI00273EC279|nr:glycerate kinase [Roseivirga thermotolerans]
MKVILCPDKFKSSLTAEEVCSAMAKGVRTVVPRAEIVRMPLADGGEGTLSVLESNLNAERICVEVSGPLFRPVLAHYLLKGNRAYIEMAEASGLPLLKTFERSAMNTSTYGTGELIAHAIGRGAKEVFVLIGGSATNDGGCGMAEALGVRFLSHGGRNLTAIRGKDLARINQIDTTALSAYKDITFVVLSDVRNPLTGPNGATHVFAPQKGAGVAEMEHLEKGLLNLAACLGNGLEDQPGAGAAGGLGYGLMSFLGAEIRSGVNTLLHMLNFSEQLDSANLILTGEGKLDHQTMSGKVVAGVIEAVGNRNIPIGIICGMCENLPEIRRELRADWVVQLRDQASGFRDSMTNAARYVQQAAAQIAKEWRSGADN